MAEAGGWRRLVLGTALAVTIGSLSIALDCYVARHHPAHYHLTHWHVRPALLRWLGLTVGFAAISSITWLFSSRLLLASSVLLWAGAVANLGGYAVLGGVPDYITLGHLGGGHYLIWNHGDFLAISGGLLGLFTLSREAIHARRQAAERAAATDAVAEASP